jgi:hypothetical protein
MNARDLPLNAPATQAAQLIDLAVGLGKSRPDALALVREAVAADLAEADRTFWDVVGHPMPMTTADYHALVLAEVDRLATEDRKDS